MNDGFMKVFRNIDKLQDAEKIVPWMKKIVYHTICDQLRKQKNSIRFLEIGDEDEKQMPQALEDLYEEDILALLEYIPNASAEVFVLYAIHGYGHKEIADLRNISEGTSKWHLSEARSKLKQLLLQKITNNNVNAI
jgi:RNA polymerase sigma factor (sigma-70 family)